MAPKKGDKISPENVPWKKTGRTVVPKIGKNKLAIVREDEKFKSLWSILEHPDAIGSGLASEVYFESAGPDCIIPGFKKPVIVAGLKVWPIEVKNPIKPKTFEPIVREFRSVIGVIDKAFDLMDKSFGK